MNILIFCALKEEAALLIKRLGLRTSPNDRRLYRMVDGVHDLRLVLTGIGRKNVERACEQYLKSPFPDVICSFGFSGSLVEGLRVGDLVLARQIALWEKGALDEAPLRFSPESRWGKFQNLADDGVYSGLCLTTPRPIARSGEKRDLGFGHQALAVDMESGFIAKFAEPHRIPFFALRAISDTVHDDLEIDFSPWIKSDGGIRIRAVLFYVLRRPGKLKSLWKMACASRKARHALAREGAKLIERLLS